MAIGREVKTQAAGEVYARKGEMVYCENGHEIGRFTRTTMTGETMDGTEIEGIGPIAFGEPYPQCKTCGGFFTLETNEDQAGGFLFKDAETGEIVGRL